jgi:hypothetical protein
VCDEGFDEGPRRGMVVGSIGGVAVESGCDGIRSGLLGGEGVFESGDVGKDWAVEFGVDAADEFWPGFSGGEATRGAVQGDDVSSGVADGFGGEEVGGDVDIAVLVAGLDETDDRELRELKEGGDTGDAFSAKASGSAAENRGCDTRQGVEVIKWIAFRCLTRNDEAPAKCLKGRVC